MTALIAAVVFLVVVVGCAGAFGLALLLDRDTTYPPEAAEAPDPIAEQYEQAGDTFGWQRAQPYTQPHIVAGSDLDRLKVRDQRLIDLRFRLLIDTDPVLSALPTEAAGLLAYEVAPEVER